MGNNTYSLRVTQERIHPDAVGVSLADATGGGQLVMLEAEFGFMLGSSLPPRGSGSGGGASEPGARPVAGAGLQLYTPAEAWAAVELVVPAVEVCATRWSGPALAAATGLHKLAVRVLLTAVVMVSRVG